MNERCDVLCHFRFDLNEMGASYPMPVSYGYRILTRGGGMIDCILHTTRWRDDDPEGSRAEIERWQSIYDGRFQEELLLPADRETYGFSDEKVETCRVDRTMPLSEFETLTGIDLMTGSQRAYGGLSGTNDYAGQGNRVHLLYDFGHVMLLQNDIHYDPAEMESVGSDFHYLHGLSSDFDISRVTGVVYIFR
jgi:hypothetical protein